MISSPRPMPTPILAPNRSPLPASREEPGERGPHPGSSADSEPSTTRSLSPAAPGAPALRRQRLIPARSRLALERVPIARQALADCHLCLHHCGANRLAGPAGRCHAGPDARFFAAQTDVSDELELIPSFAVSLSGCTLRCDFCITGEASWNPRAGVSLDAEHLAASARTALAAGVRSIMILGGEPTLHLPALLEFVAALPDAAPIVLKTNACFTEGARPLLANLFDVWLPDLKFGNPECALRLAALPPESAYWATVTSNLLWMAGQAETSDLIIRHLLMPGHIDCCWAPAAKWISQHLPNTKVSLRTGYWPAWHAARHPELRLPLPRTELDRALALAQDCRLHLIP